MKMDMQRETKGNGSNQYQSDISLKDFHNKLYVDPNYGYEEPKAVINFAVFSSKWDIEEQSEDNIIRIIHRESGDSISLAFKTLFDKIMFVKNIYSSQPIKQVGKGLNIEEMANMHIKPKEDKFIKKVFRSYNYS
jgi:hypothetical protein